MKTQKQRVVPTIPRTRSLPRKDAAYSLAEMSDRARPLVDPPLDKWWVRARAIVAISMLVPVVIAAIGAPPHAVVGTWGALAFNSAGWLLFIAGGGLRWWATLYIGHQKTRRLICDGPYSLCRNPIYASNFILALSFAMFLQSATLAIWLFPVGAIYLYNTVRNEEYRLRQAFGEAFDAYCQRVPRFVPQLSSFTSRPAVRVHMWGIACELFRMLRWMWIPFCGTLLLQIRSAPGWGSAYWLP